MPGKVLLSICCFFTAISGYAQSDRATLLKEYNRLDSICSVAMDEKPAQAVEYSKTMLEIARQLQIDSLILNANISLGQGLDFVGLFDAALKVDYETLALAERTNDCHYKIYAASLIGRIYQILGNKDKSQEFVTKGKQFAIDCKRFDDTIHLNYDFGFNIAQMGDPQKGIRIIEENLKAARKLGNPDYILFGLDNLSNLLAESGNLHKALEYELQVLEIPEVMEEDLNKAQVYEHLAEIYVLLKDWDNAQKYQREALKYAELIHLNDWIYECYKLQSSIDEARGDFKSALQNHRKYLALKDSVYQLEYEGKMASLSALYDLESKQNTIALLEKDRQIKSGQIQTQRVLLAAGLLLLLLAIAVGLFIHQRKTRRLREAFARDLIQAQEQERQNISKELHDSVGQNILFIKNRLQKGPSHDDDNLMQSVDAALDEVRTIAKGLYPNQLEVYGLSSAVATLCELAQETSGIFISSDLEQIDGRLSKEAKINCYRIIQECLNNAMKHAEATAIRVSSNTMPGKVELIVQDNGKGFDKNMLERTSLRSFGLINMEERIKMLRGKLELETAANKGAKLTFSIPV